MNKQNLFILLFCSLLLVNCKSNDTSLFGNYKTNKSTYSEKWMNYISNKCVVLGVELSLIKDSTFVISTCSYNAKGNWNIKNDSLILKYNTKEVYDSQTNSYKKNEKASNLSEVFFIKNNNLIEYIKSGSNHCIIKLKKE